MEDSLADAHLGVGVELPAWKNVLSISSAVLLALLFIVAGVWKITDPYGAATRMMQAKVPGELALFAAISFGIAETFASVLLLVPRFRRWGAWLTGGLLIAFLVWIGYHYEALQGEECSCFPWLKRAVGPGFFVGDLVMLAMAGLAGVWVRPSRGIRGAAIVLGAISVFALASWGVAYSRQTGAPAPDAITVEGQPYSLRSGKHLLYFFDPECSHCYQAAKAMSQYKWKDTKVVGLPTGERKFAPVFMQETGLNAPISQEFDDLKKRFPFGDPPFAVAIENGRQIAAFRQFEANQPEEELREIGFVE